MLNEVLELDKLLFYFLNRKIANPLFDVLMPFITSDFNLRIFLVFVWIGLLIFGGRTGRIVAILLIPAIAISDQLSSHILKPLIGRIRPCHELENVRLLVPCGSGLSFPSSHAVNSFTVAALLSKFYRRYLFYLFLLAFLISFSRVYVGVHYPGDIVAGMIIGFVVGVLVFNLWIYSAKLYENKIRKKI